MDLSAFEFSKEEIALRYKSKSCGEILDISTPFQDQITNNIISNTPGDENFNRTNIQVKNNMYLFIVELRACYKKRTVAIRDFYDRTFKK